MNILILEDEIYRLDWFSRYTFGHNVIWASTAEEAITALNIHDFNMIFLDHDLNSDHYLHYRSSLDSNKTWEEDKFDSDSGFAVASFLGNNRVSPEAEIVIHTMNSKAQKRMFDTLALPDKASAYDLRIGKVRVIPFEVLRGVARLEAMR